jgi:hypothetical protein
VSLVDKTFKNVFEVHSEQLTKKKTSFENYFRLKVRCHVMIMQPTYPAKNQTLKTSFVDG